VEDSFIVGKKLIASDKKWGGEGSYRSLRLWTQTQTTCRESKWA